MNTVLVKLNEHFGFAPDSEFQLFEQKENGITVELDCVADENEIAEEFVWLTRSSFRMVNAHGPGGGWPVYEFVFGTETEAILFMDWYDSDFRRFTWK
jgi:hypothetical protein